MTATRPSSRSEPIGSTAEPDIPWSWIVLAWAVLAGFAAAQMQLDRLLSGQPALFFRDLAWTASAWSFWLLAAPGVLALGRRFPLVKGHRARHTVLHIVAALLLALVHAPIFGAATAFFQPMQGIAEMSFLELMVAMLSWTLHAELVIYWAVLGAGQARSHFYRAQQRERRAAQLELQLGEARLDALRSQLRPHFLFNALNTVAMLARQGKNEQAVQTVAGLGQLLRATLDRDSQWIDLASEIEWAQLYLDIEQTRFEDRLSLELDVDEGLLDLKVPSLILQPLVENAVIHGLAKSEQGGHLILKASELDGRLELQVINDGPPPAPEDDEGIGLGNTRARLDQLFGDQAELTLTRRDSSTVARIRLPISELRP